MYEERPELSLAIDAGDARTAAAPARRHLRSPTTRTRRPPAPADVGTRASWERWIQTRMLPPSSASSSDTLTGLPVRAERSLAIVTAKVRTPFS